jgi:hypothetical protein
MPIQKLCHVLLDCHEEHLEEDPDSYDCLVYEMGRFGLLVGPLPTHAQALRLVPAVRDLVHTHNAWSWFYSFDTVRMKERYREPEKRNRYFDLPRTTDAASLLPFT